MSKTIRSWLLAILLLSVLLRVGLALALGDAITETRGGTHDQVSYDALAWRVATGHGFSFATDWWPGVRADQPTAFWSYLYTLYLAGIYALIGHHPLAPRLVQAVAVGLLMPWLTWRLAQRLFDSAARAPNSQAPFPPNPPAPFPAREGGADLPSPRRGGVGGEVRAGVGGEVKEAVRQEVEAGVGDRVALLAAAISAVYLYFITYAASLMTEAFYMVGILWTLDAAMRLAEALARGPTPGPRIPGNPPRPAAQNSSNSWLISSGQRLCLGIELGLAMGVTLLLRQVIVAFLAVLALWFLWLAWRRGWLRRAVAPLAAAALVVVLLLLPFVVRNYRLFGVVAMPNTNVGINFFWANHPIYGTRFEAVLSPEHGVSYQDLIPPELRGLNDAQLDRALLARGVQFVLDDPVRYGLLSLSRIPVYFQFWPTPQSTLLSNLSRLLSFGLFLPFMLYGLVLAMRNARPGGALHRPRANPTGPTDLRLAYLTLVLLFMATYTAVHLASWANVRYRLPVDAVWILFAGLALARLGETVWGRAAGDRGTREDGNTEMGPSTNGARMHEWSAASFVHSWLDSWLAPRRQAR